VLDHAQQLCVQDGGALSRINPWPTRRKFENYDESRIRGYVKRMGSECVKTGREISQGKTYEKCDKCEKKVENYDSKRDNMRVGVSFVIAIRQRESLRRNEERPERPERAFCQQGQDKAKAT